MSVTRLYSDTALKQRQLYAALRRDENSTDTYQCKECNKYKKATQM